MIVTILPSAKPQLLYSTLAYINSACLKQLIATLNLSAFLNKLEKVQITKKVNV